LLSAAPGAQAKELDWAPCGEAGAQCATAKVPLDYDRPNGRKLRIEVAKSPATDPDRRIGSLFFNFGGPGAFAAPYVEAYGADLFPVLNERFDIVGFDPRGTGIEGQNSMTCEANQETEGIYSQPFTTPFNLDRNAFVRKVVRHVRQCVSRNADLLPYTSTANVARDMETLRRAVGDRKLTYLGFSYGTFLGATYASMFPGKMRALALDGPLDAEQYINRPMQGLIEQSAALERAFGRFFQACAADQVACSGFGGSDPWSAFDELVEQANATPIPAPGYAPDPRPIDGDDLLTVAFSKLYSRQSWGEMAKAYANAANGDGSLVRQIVDEDFYGRDPETGEYDPFNDLYYMLGAVEQRYRKGDVDFYLEAGDRCWGEFDHFYVNCGYIELFYGLWPIRARDVFRGPFRVPQSAATPLVINTTYDPATPYRGGLRLVRDLGNARMLTMRGDGHAAYGQGSPDCIDPAIESYLINRVLPKEGKVCRQTDAPFTAPEEAAARRQQTAPKIRERIHTRPNVR
jgi:pimeloyl-ACP methyl ester carboxylesterase